MALADINEQLDDLGNKFAFYTAEDRADINNNLADLRTRRLHAVTVAIRSRPVDDRPTIPP